MTAFINGIIPITALYLVLLAGIRRCLDRSCGCDKKKTKLMLQSEYEALYIGGVIEYENRFSVLIAMIWVIMMFSAAMPILYFAGFILCFATYWTDKALFVSYFRIPPRHGSNMAYEARGIVEWSIIVHLFMGLYMISNPAIFISQEEEDVLEANEAVTFL